MNHSKAKTDRVAFLKKSITQPNQITKHNSYLSVMNNLVLFLLIFLISAFLLYVAYIPIFLTYTGFEEYASMGILVVLFGLLMHLFLVPVMLINISIIYFLNKKFSDTARSFKKVLTDHTAIWISTFLVYSIGLYFYSYLETFRPYITLGGSLIIIISITMYISRLILLVKYYMKNDHKKVITIYAILLVLTALCVLPLFGSNFIEQTMVNIWMLFNGLG